MLFNEPRSTKSMVRIPLGPPVTGDDRSYRTSSLKKKEKIGQKILTHGSL